MSTPKTKKSTRDLILESGAKFATAEGLEAVTHKTIAGHIGKSSSNVGYYFRSADDLRRAVALELVISSPQWGIIEFYVVGNLPDDHQCRLWSLEDEAPSDKDMRRELVHAEAFLWLARNGVTGE